MKKIIFLILSTMMIFLSACSGSGYGLLKATDSGTSLVIPSPPTSLGQAANRGVYLTITNRSSLNIDVECILDYVQGESSLPAELIADYHLNPWVSWNICF